MQDVPHLWDLASQTAAVDRADLAAEVAECATAESAAITLAERVRGARGAAVRAALRDGGAVRGRIELVAADAVLLRTGGESWLIPLPALAWIELAAPPAAMPARGLERAGGAAVLRRVVGRNVQFGDGSGGAAAGTLLEVGADHLVIRTDAADLLVPWPGSTWLRWTG